MIILSGHMIILPGHMIILPGHAIILPGHMNNDYCYMLKHKLKILFTDLKWILILFTDKKYINKENNMWVMSNNLNC